jgi:hypothetical protein
VGSRHVGTAIEQIGQAAWQTLQDYPATIAQIAETVLGDQRLVVRRVRTLNAQGRLLPSREHFRFATTAPSRSLSSTPSTPARHRRAGHP